MLNECTVANNRTCHYHVPVSSGRKYSWVHYIEVCTARAQLNSSKTKLAQPAGARIVVAVQPDLQLYTDSCSGFR